MRNIKEEISNEESQIIVANLEAEKAKLQELLKINEQKRKSLEEKLEEINLKIFIETDFIKVLIEQQQVKI